MRTFSPNIKLPIGKYSTLKLNKVKILKTEDTTMTLEEVDCIFICIQWTKFFLLLLFVQYKYPVCLSEIIGGCFNFTLPPSIVFHRMVDVFPLVPEDRTASYQAIIQIASLAITLSFAMLGGLIVGKNQEIGITSQ